MLTLNVVSYGDSKRINGTLNGNTFNVEFSKETYTALVAAQNDYAQISDITVFDEWVVKVTAILNATPGETIITTACKDLMYDKAKGKYYLKAGSKVSKKAIPQALVDVILESVEKEIDATPIIKAWTRFLRNPNFTDDKAELFANYITAIVIDEEEVDKLMEEEGFTFEKAVERASYNDVSITQHGLIVTKKYAKLLTKGWVIDEKTNQPVKADLYPTSKTVDSLTGAVTEVVSYPEFAEELTFEPPVQGRSGDAFFCGDQKEHVIKVGQVHKLEAWSQVNTNDNAFCVKGLHSGGIRYVQSYKGLNCQLLECFVDPAEIGAICGLDGGNDGAIRSKEYFVYGAVKGRTKGIYHSSHYAAIKDAEWEQMKSDAIKASEEKLQDAFDVN